MSLVGLAGWVRLKGRIVSPRSLLPGGRGSQFGGSSPQRFRTGPLAPGCGLSAVGEIEGAASMENNSPEWSTPCPVDARRRGGILHLHPFEGDVMMHDFVGGCRWPRGPGARLQYALPIGAKSLRNSCTIKGEPRCWGGAKQ